MSFRKMFPQLLRDVSFRRFWTGRTISAFGDQVTSLALPLTAVLVLHAKAETMSFLTAAVWIPAIALGIHAGAWIDRLGRFRQIMIIADVSRALLLISIPVAYAFGWLCTPLLYVVSLLIGVFAVFFNVSSHTLFASIVPTEQYVAASSLLNGSRAVSFLVGPSVAGFLVQLVSAPLTLIIDALSFLTSAACLSLIHPVEPPGAEVQPGHTSAGLRFIWGTPILRYGLAAASTMNLFNYVFLALYILYVTRTLHVSPALLGLITAVGSVGAILGSTITSIISRRIGLGYTMLIGTILFPAPLILVPSARGSFSMIITCLGLAELASGLGLMILDISYGAMFAAAVPNSLRSRVGGAWGLVNNGIRPLGALLGGALSAWVGLHGALWIGTIGACLGFLWLIPTRPRRLRNIKDFVPQDMDSTFLNS